MFEKESRRVFMLMFRERVLCIIFSRGREDIVKFCESFPGLAGFSRGVVIKTSTSNPDVALGVRPRLYSSCFKKMLERK